MCFIRLYTQIKIQECYFALKMMWRVLLIIFPQLIPFCWSSLLCKSSIAKYYAMLCMFSYFSRGFPLPWESLFPSSLFPFSSHFPPFFLRGSSHPPPPPPGEDIEKENFFSFLPRFICGLIDLRQR